MVSTILDLRFKRIHFKGPLLAANAIQFIYEELKQTENETSNQIESEPIPNILSGVVVKENL